MINPVASLKRRGLVGTIGYTCKYLSRRSGWYKWRTRKAPLYEDPTSEQLASIEASLNNMGVRVEDYYVDPVEFLEFKSSGAFPEDYHGGKGGGVWDEKVLEHFIAGQFLDLSSYADGDIYVDVAACNSPWANYLREERGLSAYAIDLTVGEEFRALPYYRREDATATTFANKSVRGASLQCAFELFSGSDDVDFVAEVSRILAPGGSVVILPLYMHTHYCTYATREYWGRGYAASGAVEYVRADTWGVQSSRKYDPATLSRRILEPATDYGLSFRLLALRNKGELGDNIYCHFVLELYR